MAKTKYAIFYGLSGGFGGAVLQTIAECRTQEEADDIAYMGACEQYQQYEGNNGLRDVEEIMDDDGVGEVEANEIYEQEREDWLDYYAEPYDESKHQSNS